jgi:alpha-beta hydrolase superfamily lysophospholipase
MSGDASAEGEAIEIASVLGPVRCRLHLGSGPAAVIMVGGGDGGFDGPAEALYPTLANDLHDLGIGALRLDFRIHRFPGPIEDGVLDVYAGIDELARRGVERIGLLGHSFGGAVVIEAAARDLEGRVASVATLATQTAGALRVGELAPRPILLVHGLRDDRLPPLCSEMLYERAGEPRRLELLEGATHSLRQRREEVRRMLVDWFGTTLGASTGG